MSAENGYAQAQYVLGKIYRNGVNVFPEQYRDSIQRILGLIYGYQNDTHIEIANPWDVPPDIEVHRLTSDPERAVQWLTKAAEDGHPEAQYALGDCYMNGIGVAEASRKTALSWYHRAADAGLPAARQALYEYYMNRSKCYLSGNGVKRSICKAISLYLEAMQYDDT